MSNKSISICYRASRARFKFLRLPTLLSSGATRSLLLSNTNHLLQSPSPFIQYNLIHTSISTNPPTNTKSPEFEKWALNQLPLQCPGCGAPSQIIDKHAPGYYNLKRHAIKRYLGITRSDKKKEQDEIVRLALQRSAAANLDIELGTLLPQVQNKQTEVVKCCRCRNLADHGVAISIEHPSVDIIREMLEETPYKYNHIYHVVDAADFPMSVISNLHSLLNASPLRSKNRRSKVMKFYQDRIIEISFIITRSDLLAPLKEHVDSMMPYFRLVLRDALGPSAAGMRLGNIHCVSVKRDWWTKELKEEVWRRGGAGWMVGKVNVGKSKLFNSIFPKGRKGTPAESESKPKEYSPGLSEDSKNDENGKTALETEISQNCDENLSKNVEEDKETELMDRLAPEDQALQNVDQSTSREIDENDENGKTVLETEISQNCDENLSKNVEEVKETELMDRLAPEDQALQNVDQSTSRETDENDDVLDPGSLLLPVPAEVDYPTMPIASDLPGTTISPIRLYYGNGKGELIDLPGVQRGDLEEHVKPAHRFELLMRSRIQPEQLVILPHQSLLLGGFIRITPTSPDITILAYAFTPINPHITGTLKAIGTQTETRVANVPNIAVPGIGMKIASAGKFLLKWDVTKIRTGPVTARDAGRVRVEQLPYRVVGIDIMIEGCGWVELSAQVSKRRGESIIKPLDINSNDVETPKVIENQETGETWPAVEVFTPCGKYVADRRPMNAWSFLKKKSKKSQARPRMPIAWQRESMRSVKPPAESFSQDWNSSF